MLIRKLAAILLTSLFLLTACAAKPYGHYEDDKMIGKVMSVDTGNRIIDVDISEWRKRDLRGDINAIGYSIRVKATDDLILADEDGTPFDIGQLKNGQKVLVNPPQDSDADYTAKEVIVLEMTYEEKYAHLLSRHADKYSTTVFVEEGQGLSQEIEDRLMGFLSKSGLSFGAIDQNYVVNYSEELDIEQFPVMLVFDQEGLVLKTYDIDELERFFAD